MQHALEKPHHHVTAGIIRRRDRLLVTRRPEGTHLSGFWEFPGGKQEPDESLEACLEREIQEELGTAARTGKRLFVVEHEYEDKRVTLHFFDCTLLGRVPTRGLEGQEVRWVRPEDLSELRFPPPDRCVIEHLQKNGGSG